MVAFYLVGIFKKKKDKNVNEPSTVSLYFFKKMEKIIFLTYDRICLFSKT